MNKTICIDPGKKTGIAHFREGELVELETLNFWKTIQLIDEYQVYKPHYIVELPNSRKMWHSTKNKLTHAKAGVDVGGVIREAELIIEYLKINGRSYQVCPPVGKAYATKEMLYKLSGWNKRSNQHERDAAMLYLSKNILTIK